MRRPVQPEGKLHESESTRPVGQLDDPARSAASIVRRISMRCARGHAPQCPIGIGDGQVGVAAPLGGWAKSCWSC